MRRDWHSRYSGHRGPPPFVRRMGCVFAALMVLAAIGAGTLVSMLFRAPRQTVTVAVSAFIVAALLAAAFAFAISRVSRTFREQDRLRRRLMADVAHELRTPLSILQGRIEGLIDGVYAPDAERLSELHDEMRHLSRLVDDLGTLANAEAGALDLRKESVDAAELIRDVAASFGRPIDVVLPRDLPSIEIDPVRIREVLLNLLSNAVRYTAPADSIVISAEAEPRRLIIEVRDRGAGIPAEALPFVFERFHKGPDSRGSGLGLGISRDLVHAHGGTIDLKSVRGEGTTVTVSLPR